MKTDKLSEILRRIQLEAIAAVGEGSPDGVKVTITVSCGGKWVQTIVARERPRDFGGTGKT